MRKKELPLRMSTVQFRDIVASGTLTKLGTSSKKPKNKSPEEDLQRLCIEWRNLHCAKYPKLKKMFHVPNGGKRPKGEAGKLKALGTMPGVPDLMLPIKNGIWIGLALELKSPIGKTTDEQNEWITSLNESGYLTAVIRTLDEFIEYTMKYLSGK